jgi:hypothetical protein
LVLARLIIIPQTPTIADYCGEKSGKERKKPAALKGLYSVALLLPKAVLEAVKSSRQAIASHVAHSAHT